MLQCTRMASPSGYDSLDDMKDFLEQDLSESSPQKAPKGSGKKRASANGASAEPGAFLSKACKIKQRRLQIIKNNGKILSVSCTITKLNAQVMRCNYEIWKAEQLAADATPTVAAE